MTTCQPAAPLPLLLVPGLLCDGELWRPQIEAVKHAAPQRQIGVADHTRFESVSEIAQALLELAPPRFALAGLSMGGYVAFEVMRRAPARIAAIAFLDTTARPDSPEQLQRRRGLIALSEKGQFKGVTPRLLPLLIHERRLKDESLVGTITTMAERVGQPAFVRQQKAIMGRADSRPGLAAITCPALVICGRQDALTPPEHAEEIAAGIPGADLLVLADCGHLSTLEQPARVSRALLGWLEGVV